MAQTFKIISCSRATALQANESSKRKDFFSAARKVGDLQVLNEIGGGKVGKVLRTMSKVSDSVRTGRGTLPSVIGQAADNVAAGGAWVLGQLGISDAAIASLNDLKPAAANNALGQAKALYQKIRQGNFSLDDIPEFFSDFQNLEQLFRGIYTPKPSDKARDILLCDASPWATDLIAYAPKYKFLFIVQFDFTDPHTDLRDLSFAFVVKGSTRPNINFEYDDVNYYNFHTKIIKRMVYEPMEMRFYDDDYNQAMRFYEAYLKAISPISNMSFEEQKTGDVGMYEESGMDYGNGKQSPFPPFPTQSYSSSIGVLGGGAKTVLKRIGLYHVYRQGRLMNVYNFYNPRVENLQLDDLDMAENGGGNEVTIRFNFDGMFVAPGVSTDPAVNKMYSLEEINKGGNLPLKYRRTGADKSEQPAFDPNVPRATEVGGKFTNDPNDWAQHVSGAVTGAAGRKGGPGSHGTVGGAGDFTFPTFTTPPFLPQTFPSSLAGNISPSLGFLSSLG